MHVFTFSPLDGLFWVVDTYLVKNSVLGEEKQYLIMYQLFVFWIP